MNRATQPQPATRISRDDLALALSNQPALAHLSLTPRDSRAIVDALFSNIRSHVQEGRTVMIFGFGSFSGQMIPARRVRNARAGKWIQVGPRVRYGWKPGTDWQFGKSA